MAAKAKEEDLTALPAMRIYSESRATHHTAYAKEEEAIAAVKA